MVAGCRYHAKPSTPTCVILPPKQPYRSSKVVSTPARADANAAVVQKWIDSRDFAANLAKVEATRSNTSVCLTLQAEESVPKKMVKLLEAEKAAFDIGSYRDAPPGLRIWCGATVETADLEALMPWLDWAYAQATAG